MAKLVTTNGQLVTSGHSLLLRGAPPPAALRVDASGGNSDPGHDGFAPGIYGNAGKGLATLLDDPANGGTHCVGTFVLRGMVGVPVIRPIGGSDAATGAYYLTGLNNLSLFTRGLFYQSIPKPAYHLVVTVQDDAATYTCAVTVNTAKGCLIIEGSYVFDTSRTNAYGYEVENEPKVSSSSINFSTPGNRLAIDDPSDTFQTSRGNEVYTKHRAAQSRRYGTYPVSFTDTANRAAPSQPGYLYIMAEQRPAVRVDLASVYSTAQVGDVIGTVASYSEVGVASLTVVGDQTNAISLGSGGVLTLRAAIPAGVGKAFTVRATSNSGKVTDRVVLFTVLPGRMIDPANMNANVAPTANYSPDCLTATRTVLTPAVSGIPGRVTWSLTQEFGVIEFFAGGKLPNFQMADAATGVVSTSVQLRADTYQLTLRATNGPLTCIRTFPVTVAAVAGPVIFVGRNMTKPASAEYRAAVAAFGRPGMTSELFGPIYRAMNGYGACPAAYAGARIYVFANSDIDYHANQTNNGSGLDRFGMAGPATITGVPFRDTMPRFGGRYGSGTAGGMDSGGKGNLVFNNGDFLVENIWFSDVHANPYQGDSPPSSNYSGCGIRWNATAYGSLTVRNCYFSDCDQGIETGVTSGTVTIQDTEIVNCGGVYVGSGATHNAYIGDCYRLTVDNLLSWRTVNGHTLKVRAMNSHIGNSRFFDGERGGASNLLDFPNSGVHVVDGCVIHKGTFAQNPYALNAFEDTQDGAAPSPENTITVRNSTFIVNTDPLQVAACIFMQGLISHINGHRSSVLSMNNAVYGIEPAKFIGAAGYVNYNNTPSGDSTPPRIVETGTVLLATQPRLNLSHPFKHTGGVPARPGPLYYPYDGESRNNYAHSGGVQIDPGDDDIHLSVSRSAPGAVVLTATAIGATYFRGASPQPDRRVAPFVAGTTWQLVDKAQVYTGGAYTLAPAGRYALAPSSDGTRCAVRLATTLPASLAGGADRICLLATAPSGIKAQGQIYIALDA